MTTRENAEGAARPASCWNCSFAVIVHEVRMV